MLPNLRQVRYLTRLKNPLDLLRTKKLLQVNTTIPATRKEPDLYLSNVNLRMNEVMKVMAVATCLLAPATVIGGIFGMNFENIPWLHNKYGFFIAAGTMLIIPIWMISMFKKKGWF